MCRNAVRALFLAGLVASLCGCLELKITGSGGIDKTADGLHVSETVHGSFYGFFWSEPRFMKPKQGQEIIRVDYHDNALYLLASVVSLGLWVPQGVEWWCGELPEEEAGPSLRRNPGR